MRVFLEYLKLIAISILTLSSIVLLIFYRIESYIASFFWVYAIIMACFLLFVQIITRFYKPVPDKGYRPSVSIIVPSKNEEAVIGQAVNAILASDYPEDRIEVVVVDDGSTDRTSEVVRNIKSDRIKLLEFECNQGKRLAFAAGVNASKNEVVICIDSDTLVEKESIKFLVQPFIDNDVVAVCGHGKAANVNKNFLTRVQHFWYQGMFRLIKGMESKLGNVTCCSGILAAYRRGSVLPVLQMWTNETFLGRKIFIGDDRQLTNLVLWKGLGDDASKTRKAKVVYQSNAVAKTFVPENSRHFFKQQLRWKRAWIHGSLLAARYVFKKKFPIPLVFIVYQFLTYASPIIIVTALIILPLMGKLVEGLLFVVGTVFIAILQGLTLWSFDYDLKSTFYGVLFVPISFFMSLTVLLYAWFTPWKGGWVTRSEKIGAK